MSDTILYDRLGVSRDANDQEIKNAYEKLSETNPSDKTPESVEKFKEILFAYEVLSDENKRRIYDVHGLEMLKENDDGSTFDLDSMTDILGQVSGDPHPLGTAVNHSASERNRRQRRKGDDIARPLKVTLEQLYKGDTQMVEISRKIICQSCRGVGGREGAKEQCKACSGQGIQVMTRQVNPNVIQRMKQICPKCSGEGEIINEIDRCKACLGKKLLNEKTTLEVIILPGSIDEQQLRFPGESDQLLNMDPGDVIIVLHEEPHSVFKRDGDNLFMKHKITLAESLCGFQFVITHLDGRKIVLTHPANDPIGPETFRCVKGQGMINMKTRDKGDLIIEFDIEFPSEKSFPGSENIKKLESILPERPYFNIPPGEHVVEVQMMDFHTKSAYDEQNGNDSDDFDDESHRPGVHACRSQ